MNNKYNLDARLSAIASHLVPCDVTADVGCDHGIMSLFVLKAHISQHIVCTDISAKCLQKTRVLLHKARLDERAYFVQCDGLEIVTDQQIDQIIIAGMGGTNIASIVERLPQKSQNARLILQPMNNVSKLRLALNTLGKKIIRDEIIFDKNKYYHIIVAEPGAQKLTLRDISCGAIVEDYRTEDYQKWLELKIQKVQTILSGITPQNPKYIELSDYLELLKTCKF